MKFRDSIIGLIVSVVVFMISFIMDGYSSRERKQEAINSKVISKYRDYKNHGHGVIVLKSSKKIVVGDNTYDEALIGDSMVKHSGEDSIYVYRGKELKVYKY